MRALQPIAPVSAPQYLRAALYLLRLSQEVEGRSIQRATLVSAQDILRRIQRLEIR